MDPIKMIKTIEDVYSCFTNNGYVNDSTTLNGLSEDGMTIKDLMVLPDITRFIPIVVQTLVREALEPNLLIVPNCFQTVNVGQGRSVQIGAIGAMTANIIPEGENSVPSI